MTLLHCAHISNDCRKSHLPLLQTRWFKVMIPVKYNLFKDFFKVLFQDKWCDSNFCRHCNLKSKNGHKKKSNHRNSILHLLNMSEKKSLIFIFTLNFLHYFTNVSDTNGSKFSVTGRILYSSKPKSHAKLDNPVVHLIAFWRMTISCF